jgi:hypothetical protein
MRGGDCARGDFSGWTARDLEERLKLRNPLIAQKFFNFVCFVVLLVLIKSKKKKVAFLGRTWQIQPSRAWKIQRKRIRVAA